MSRPQTYRAEFRGQPVAARATVTDGECELHRVAFLDARTGAVLADVAGHELTERAHAEISAAVLLEHDALETEDRAAREAWCGL